MAGCCVMVVLLEMRWIGRLFRHGEIARERWCEFLSCEFSRDLSE